MPRSRPAPRSRHVQQARHQARTPHQRPPRARLLGHRPAPQGAGLGRLPGRLPLHQKAAACDLRRSQEAAADRAAEDAELGEGHGPEGGRALRGPRRRGQGRHHQALHGAPQSPWRPRGGPREARRARAGAVVLPALRVRAADRGGDRVLRPVMVQPRRRRAGDGILHRGAVPRVPGPRRRPSSACSSSRATSSSSTGSR